MHRSARAHRAKHGVKRNSSGYACGRDGARADNIQSGGCADDGGRAANVQCCNQYQTISKTYIVQRIVWYCNQILFGIVIQYKLQYWTILVFILYISIIHKIVPYC